LNDTLCEHVGSLFDYVDRHYNHGDATYPLAHNPVTSHYVSGPVRFPVDLRLYRRYEEFTRWEAFVRAHFPARPIPTQKKERARLHKEVDPVLRQDPDFEKLHQQFRTKIDLGIELLESAIEHKVPFSVLLFDSWYLADELVSMARYHQKDWISLLKKNRNLETKSFVLKDAAGKPIPLEGPHIAVEDLVPLILPTAYQAVTVRDNTYWTFTLAVRLPGLGKVRLVVSFKSVELTGTYVVLVTNRVEWGAATHPRPVFATLADRNLWSCTSSLRLIREPDRPGTIPSLRYLYEGFCHGLPSLFLPVGAHRLGVAVSHTPWAMAKRPRCRMLNDTGAPTPTA